MIAPKIPNTDISMANFISIFLFFKFTIIATMAVGIKKIRLVACATCCSTPNIKLKQKIRMVPPPIPVPLTIPDTIPAGSDNQNKTESSGGFNWLLAAVIIVVVLFVGVAVMAVVVLNGKPKKQDDFYEEGNDN